MPWAGNENRCRAEKLPFAAGGADGGPSPGLYAAAGNCPADADSNAAGSDPGYANRPAAIFNADARSIPNPNARTGNYKANSGGNQQYGRSHGPLYPAD